MCLISGHDSDTGASICSFARRPTVPEPICSSWITTGWTARSSSTSCFVSAALIAGQRPARLPDPVAGTVLRETLRPRRPCSRRQHHHAQRQDRTGPDLPTTLAGLLDRQSPDGLTRRPTLRVLRRAGHLPHRAASPLRTRQRPCRREVEG